MLFALTLICLLSLATLLIVAALGDVRRYRISNRMNLAIALLALPWWVAQSGADPLMLWSVAWPQLLLAGVVFLLMLLAMHFRLFGGGDAKMLIALAFWFPVDAYLQLLTIMAITGGVLSAGLLIHHRLVPGAVQAPLRRPRVPYGVAIAAGALVPLCQRIVNALVG